MADNTFAEEGQRRGTQIIHAGDGFHYYYDYARNDGANVYLKCILQYRLHCRGRAVYTDEGGIQLTVEHNHLRDPILPFVKQLRRNILDRCRERRYAPYHTILTEERRRFPRPVQARVTMGAIRTSMWNARMGRYPNIPLTLDGLVDILQNPRYRDIAMTYDGEDNIFADYVEATDGSKCVIFASRRMLDFMERVKIIFSDGTFSTPALPRASQIFNIVTVWNWHVIPLVHCLMERRTGPAYQAVFQRLKLLSPFFNPEVVINDYELALLRALRMEFPNADSDGCLFHFVVATVRYAKYELGMIIIIRENPVVKRIVQLCCAIPLAPPHMMRGALRAIAAEARLTLFYDDLIPFFDYLWDTWLSGPRYESLSVCGSVHRTNNACESFNHVMGSEFGEHHVNVYRFIECMSNIEDTAQTDILTLYEGLNPGRPRKTSSLSNDARIKLWTQNLLDGLITIREFVHCVSPTLHGLFEDQIKAGP